MRVSTSEQVADLVAALPEGSFVAVRDVGGSRSAVESAFSRLCAAGDVLRVRKGLYWKGTTTPLGMSPPRIDEIARLLHSLTPDEVAVLEVLRAGPAVVETPGEELSAVIARLAASATVRLEVLDESAATEPHRQARARWAALRAHL